MKHPHTAHTRALNEARSALLRLHKQLLDAEQLRYERENGRVSSGGALLQLVIHDPAFAWLRTLSGLVVRVDEELEGDEPMSDARAREVTGEIRALLLADEAGEEFQKNYHRALQDAPEIVIAHREVMRILDTSPGSK